ncbi:MAG: hypothetical protein WCW27_01505 [Patescibacteria group bacterium]|jgi:hypothetical protein
MNLATLSQEQTIISIREFIRNLSKITSKPASKIYTVVKNGKKVGTYIPEESEKEIFTAYLPYMQEAQEKKYNSFFDDYDKICYSGDPNLSQMVDEVVYGIK